MTHSSIWPLTILLTLAGPCLSASSQEKLSESLTFYASFDSGADADFAVGDDRLRTLVSTKPDPQTKSGLHTEDQTSVTKDEGLGDSGALKFTKRNAKWIFYSAEKNVSYTGKNWSGTVSVWLRLDPADLDPGYNDPIQLTTRTWNDGAFFVDFDKEGSPRDFRLGAFPDLTAWNPDKADVPEDKRPLLKVKKPPFTKDEWTHVVFTWEKFNSGDDNGTATFYLNGENNGTITGWNQTFTWKPDEEKRLYLGLNYQGLLDDLSCFSRALTGNEVADLYKMKKGLHQLIPKDKSRPKAK
jgi:hypothetical protein